MSNAPRKHSKHAAAIPTEPGVRPSIAAMFPASVIDGSSRRKRRQRRLATLGITVVLLGSGGFAVARASGTDPTSYRTIAVATHDVATALNGVATIEPVSQAKVAFPVAGTVNLVTVKVGDTVTAGQQLATLDVAALTMTLHQKQAALDKANLVLAKALDGDDVSSLTGGSMGASFVLSDAVIAKMAIAEQSVSRPSAVTPDVAAAQQAVLAAQQAVDADISNSSSALASATSVCGSVSIDPAAADQSGTLTALGACQTALSSVLAAQNQVRADQTTLATASTALDALLAQVAATPTTTPTPTTDDTTTTTAPSTGGTTTSTTATGGPGGGSSNGAGNGGGTSGSTTADGSTPTDSTPTDSTPSGGGGGSFGGSGGGSVGGSGGGSASATKTPSAADLVSYQKAVDAAAADVTVAEQAIAQANIVSPIAGTVIAVGLAVGDSATAASTTQNIVVQGDGGFEATTTVSLTDVPKVKVGQAATVLADGTSTPVTGTVVSVSLAPTSSTTTTYGVVIALTGDTSMLNNGAIGSVSLVTGTSAAALAVPTSAITTTGTTHTVTVLDGTTTSVVRVQIGVMGDSWTSITSGLTAGQEVVLATIGKALPSSATSSSNTATQTPTGFPGGGNFPAGGFGGARP